MNPLHNFQSHFSDLHFSIILASTNLPYLRGLFDPDLPIEILWTFLISHVLSTSFISFHHTNNIAWRVQVMKALSLQFFSSSLVTYVLDLNILLSTLFAITLNLCSTLSMGDQVSHPYRTLLHTQHVCPTADVKWASLAADRECLVHTIMPAPPPFVPAPGCTRMRVCLAINLPYAHECTRFIQIKTLCMLVDN